MHVSQIGHHTRFNLKRQYRRWTLGSDRQPGPTTTTDIEVRTTKLGDTRFHLTHKQCPQGVLPKIEITRSNAQPHDLPTTRKFPAKNFKLPIGSERRIPIPIKGHTDYDDTLSWMGGQIVVRLQVHGAASLKDRQDKNHQEPHH